MDLDKLDACNWLVGVREMPSTLVLDGAENPNGVLWTHVLELWVPSCGPLKGVGGLGKALCG